jgi:putative protease
MKNKITNKIELLAPAGNLEKMKTAFLFGADAVYLGVPDFSLRIRINDFDLKSLEKAIKLAHKINKKAYITINIFSHNHHLLKLPLYIKKLKELNADAIIVSDAGVLAVIKKIWPEAEIHLSTQANCTNWQAVKFWAEQGVKRVILGREVTLREIKEIHKKAPQIELEYFIHGAMCMAYSGRCFLSSYFVGRSANLGDCAQPCRWPYEVKSRKSKVEGKNGIYINEEKRPDEILEIIEEKHGSYILNSKDLCLIEYLDDLVKAGVTSFKIEGRAKSIYYIAAVVGAYREAISLVESRPCLPAGRKYKVESKKVKFLKKELENKLVNRGYTTGFLLGRRGEQERKYSHQKSGWEFCGQIVDNANAANYMRMPRITNNANKNILIKVHNTLKVGDDIEILMPFYDIIKLKLDKMVDVKNGKEIQEAHGGGKQVVIIEVNEDVPDGRVVRRRIIIPITKH